jgi:hypothetical protein
MIIRACAMILMASVSIAGSSCAKTPDAVMETVEVSNRKVEYRLVRPDTESGKWKIRFENAPYFVH